MTLPRLPSAVIFDMDGLLFDTEALWQAALLSAAAEVGRAIPDEVYARSIGVRRSQCRDLFLSHFGDDFPFDDFHASWRRHFWLIAEHGLALKPGALELLEVLDRFGLPRAIATSSSRTTAAHHLASHGLTDRFDQLVCHGDYENGKPAPDPFLKAAERLGVAPRLCLALEDSHVGVRSASAAGMMTVMAPDLLAPTEEIAALCVLVARDLHHVRELVLASSEPGRPPSAFARGAIAAYLVAFRSEEASAAMASQTNRRFAAPFVRQLHSDHAPHHPRRPHPDQP